MVVPLKPTYEGERFRRCSKCKSLGLESPILHRSMFRFRRTRGFYASLCWVCEHEGSRAWRERNREQARASRQRSRSRERQELERDPEKLRLHREKRREWDRMRRLDPEKVEALRAAKKRYYQEKKKDPKWVELQRENERIRYHAKRRTPAVSLGMPSELRPNADSDQYPAKRFRAFFDELLERERVDAVSDHSMQSVQMKALERARARLGLGSDVGARALYRFRFENSLIDERWLDYMLTTEGSTSIENLYPEGPFRYPRFRQRCRDGAAVRGMLASLGEAFRRLT